MKIFFILKQKMEDVYWVYSTPRIGNPEEHTLVYRSNKSNLSKSHYFKSTSVCSICFDALGTPKNVVITDCGHSFHINCLYKYYCIKLYDMVCPLCRCDIVDFNECKRIYKNTNNMIDHLENFWHTFSFQLPRLCCSDFTHFCGSNKKCTYCLNYISTGNYTDLTNKAFKENFKLF